MSETSLERKVKSLNSIILRQYVYIKILSNDYNYSFVLNKERRKASKHLHYFPIDQIIGPHGEVLFDINKVELVGCEKTRYGQVKTMSVMENELGKYGYEFETTVKKEGKKAYGIYGKLQTNTVWRMSRNVDDLITVYDMRNVEEVIGGDLHDLLSRVFIKEVKKVIVHKDCETIKNIAQFVKDYDKEEIRILCVNLPCDVLSFNDNN